jgi:hypothetical protein
VDVGFKIKRVHDLEQAVWVDVISFNSFDL